VGHNDNCKLIEKVKASCVKKNGEEVHRVKTRSQTKADKEKKRKMTNR